MNNMDLQSFYQHALQWQHQHEEAERMAEEERQRDIAQKWDAVRQVVYAALPIHGMRLMETRKGQFEDYPYIRNFQDIDCVFPGTEPARRMEEDVVTAPLVGEIRARLYWDEESDEENKWQVYKFLVKIGDETYEFENAYQAFLKVYQPKGG